MITENNLLIIPCFLRIQWFGNGRRHSRTDFGDGVVEVVMMIVMGGIYAVCTYMCMFIYMRVCIPCILDYSTNMEMYSITYIHTYIHTYT